MHRILSLTHTNPLVDARILKAHSVMENLQVPLLILGIRRGYGESQAKEDFYCVESKTKKIIWRIFPESSRFRFFKIFLMLIVYFELFVKLLVKGITFRPTVIHVNDFYVLPIAVAIKGFRSVKIIYDAHELESETNGITNNMRKAANLIEEKCWKSIDFFITVSPSILDWYMKKYNRKDSEIIMNSPQIDLSQKSSLRSRYFREVFPIANESKVFLYLGNLERGRGIQTILTTFSELSAQSVIIFMGAGSLEAEIQEYSERYLNIFLHAPVAHNLVTQAASSADFGICLIENVSLSDYFCLPNKLFENIFSGLPVVASKLPDIKNLIEKYSVGICIDNTCESLTQAVLEIKVEDYSMNSFDHKNLAELSWEFQAKKLESIYRNMLK